MIFALIGLLAFLLAGFGLGGGVLLIPVLINFFDFDPQVARYFALVAYLPASLGVIIYNFKNNKGEFLKIIKLIPLGVLGTLLGSLICSILNVDLFKKIYGLFLVVFGINMLISVISDKKTKKTGRYHKKI